MVLGVVLGTKEIVKQFVRTWYLWTTVLAAAFLYLTIHWEARYISPFVAMGWASLICLIRLPDNQDGRRLVKSVVVVVVAAMALQAGFVVVREAMHNHQVTQQNREITEGLYAAGIEPNQKIAEVNGYVAIWEWLARVSVVAEVSDEYPEALRPTNRDKQGQIYKRLAATGATALISSTIPQWASNSDWQEIGHTRMYIHYLDRQ